MGRRKKRQAEPTKYLKGAHWKDVLKGRPVTTEDAKKKPVPVRKRRCRDCGWVLAVSALSHKRYCCRCGGFTEPMRDEQ